MGDIIDFNKELNARGLLEGNTYTDSDGVVWKEFSCGFDHSGKKFTFDIWAKSFEDADDKLCAIIESGEVLGEIIETDEKDDR